MRKIVYFNFSDVEVLEVSKLLKTFLVRVDSELIDRIPDISMVKLLKNGYALQDSVARNMKKKDY